MKEDYTRLFEYNLWANKEFSEVLRANQFKNEKILKFTSHIGNAQSVWLSRVKGEESELGVWDEHELKDAIELLTDSSQAWLDYLYSEEDIDSTIEYMDSKGNSYETRIEDVLKHVVNHSTHHRGQIALLLREEDIDPPVSDYIHYVRN